MTLPRRRRILADLTPLRESAPYRQLFASTAMAHLGRQMTIVAIPYQVYEMTGSTALVGALGLAQVIPLLTLSVVGGGLADAFDRRRIAILSQFVLVLSAIMLTVNSLALEPSVVALFALTALGAAITAIDAPTRAALTPMLVTRSQLAQSLALEHILRNLAKALVPAVAGLLIAAFGLPITYLLEAVFVAAGIPFLVRMPSMPPHGGGSRFSFESIKDGFRFLASRRLLKSIFIIDWNATVFGTPTALFPAFGTDVLGGSAATVGLLYAAPGMGALLAATLSGWVSQVRRQGAAVIAAILVWGASLLLFGLSSHILFAVGMLAVAGSADLVSAVYRNTILQLSVPDELRGRLSSLNLAVVAAGPRMGDLEAGVVAALTSVRISITSGGAACIGGALLIASRYPELRRYRGGSLDGVDD